MIKNQSGPLTIRPKLSSSAIMAGVVVVLLVLIVAAYFSYQAGIKKGYENFESDKILLQQLSGSVESLRSELASSEQNLIFAQRQQQIQEEAYKQLSKAYSNSEEKNSVLGSRLDFYRSIISPEDGKTGPSIQGLESDYVDGVLTFDITLVQAIKHKKQVQGSLTASLYQNGKLTGQWPLSSKRSVNYQYFQQVSGTIEIAKLSANSTLKVELTLQSGDKIERTFTLPKVQVESIEK